MKISPPRPLALIVEDSPDLCRIYGLLLSHKDFELHFCCSAEEAYTSYCEFSDRINLIITDGQMSGESGVWLAHQVRSHSKNVPIVFISGMVKSYCATHCEGLFSGILEKPFKIEDFTEMIETVMTASCEKVNSVECN